MLDSESKNELQERKPLIIGLGVAIGAIFGLISSYLYTRAAEENDNPDAGKTESISTGQLLALLIAVVGVIRQIAELGKPDKKKK